MATPPNSPRRRIGWRTINLAVALLTLMTFLWVAIAVVDLETVDARIVSHTPSPNEEDLIEFEYAGQNYRVGARGHTDAPEGSVVQAWFWSYNPLDVTYQRQTMLVFPVVVAAGLAVWVVWAIRLRYRSEPLRHPSTPEPSGSA
jgi:hypothetical protein